MTEHNSHYKEMPIEPFNLIRALLTKEEWRGFLKGNMIKYAMRAGRKPSEPTERDVSKYNEYRLILKESEGES